MFPIRIHKSVELDNISGFIITGHSKIFAPVLKRILNFQLSHQNFPILWKQSTTVLVFREANSAPRTICRLISVLKIVSTLFLTVFQAHFSHYLMFNLNHFEHIFTKFKSTFTNLVNLSGHNKPLVTSQRQVHYYISVSDLVSHALLFHKLSVLGFLMDMWTYSIVT
jgi:hypothetical protein